ncbi:ribonuclease Z [Methanobrevibacter curvatus]|uniref:Ribonuclease Z n=1 Tax=Methanobrevibacter curvatus TaxID=49547 RepID=A0A166E460_9EURY|nr:ribonuclease Z [Methanobrevibacter curvatus]KZX16260.1 ribonuclease Z [Methanobrevibacter curvatus]
MELVFLGTSAALPSQYRNHSSICLKAFGEVILFDCGEATQRQLTIAKISPMKINKIFLSHYHGDHVIGLPGLIQSMDFRSRTKPLHLYGPKGLNELKNAILHLGYCSIEFPIILHEIDPKEETIIFENEEYLIKGILTKHTVDNISYSIVEKKKPRFLKEKAIELGVKEGPNFGKLHRGKNVRVGEKIITPEEVLGPPREGIKISYSGDTRPDEKMVELSKNSDILIHEGTYEEKDKEKAEKSFHSTVKEGAEIAKQSNSKFLILTHFSTRYTKDENIEKEAKNVFKNTKIAYDFLTIDLSEIKKD